MLVRWVSCSSECSSSCGTTCTTSSSAMPACALHCHPFTNQHRSHRPSSCRIARPATATNIRCKGAVGDQVTSSSREVEGKLFSDKFWRNLDGAEQQEGVGVGVPNEEDWEEYWEGEEQEDDMGSSSTGKKRLPAAMRCFDTASILVKAGDGGRGCVAFRREKFVAKGGPAGGDGGRGGHVWVVADDSLNSLQPFRRQVHFRAEKGESGKGSSMHGRQADDLYVRVPPGTIIRRKGAAEDEPPMAELIEAGQKALLLPGGRGGRGNKAFKTSRNPAPAISEHGEKGTELWVDLELKVVADVGIVGVPNAGKSTLLSVVSAAKPKIANYPFTTLVPNLGVCELDFKTTVFADVPGLLEGAHLGIGLGHEFLRHCQRCRVLVHVVDGTSRDPLGDWRAIQTELQLFNAELSEKRQVVAYNKMDLPDSSDYWEDVKEYLMQEGVAADDIIPVSAVTGQGVLDLVRRVRGVLDQLPAEGPALSTVALNLTQVPKGRSAARLDDFQIEADKSVTPHVWYVTGEAIERFAQMTNWDYYEALSRFQAVMQAAGVNASLRRGGIKEGETVVIGDVQLEWSDDQSPAALYDAWNSERKALGIPSKGMARWPHATKGSA